MTGSQLDDPDHDPTAMQFHLARDLPVQVNGTELDGLNGEVEEALHDLLALPDDEAFGGDLVGVTSALMGVQRFLRKLRERFDAAARERPR
jgi:hypothetical protein